jgi:copper resistance protein C
MIALLAVTTVIGVGAPGAAAHASLVGASPADGATVTAAPRQVTLTFDEPVREPAVIIVTDPQGRRVDRGGAQLLNDVLRVDLAPLAVPGRYTVAFRVLSDDGHPVAEALSFAYRAGGTAATGGSGATGGAASPAAHRPADAAGGSAGGWAVGGVAAVLLLSGGLMLGARGRRRPRRDGAPPGGAS